MPRRPLTVALTVASLLTAGLLATAPTTSVAAMSSWSGVVTEVEDGDTFRITLDGGEQQHIRVAGINTNETNLPVDCLAIAARERLRDLILGQRVELRARSATSTAGGRPIRHVFTTGGVNVAELMVREGWGVPLVFPAEFDYAEKYVDAFWDANQAGVRLHDPDACGAGPAAGAQIDMLVNGDADGSDNENVNGEWVLLRNTGSSSLDLSGWYLKDTALGYYAFPDGRTIAPGGALRLRAGIGSDTASTLYMGNSSPIFSAVDGAFLLDPDGDIRVFDLWPCRGLCGDAPPADLVIDEVVYDIPGVNDDLQPNGETITIRNVGDATVDLLDWRIESFPHLVYSESSRVLGPGQSVTVKVGTGTSTSSVIHMQKSASILDNDGDVVVLVNPAGDVADCVSWGDRDCSWHPAKGVRSRSNPDFNGDGWGDVVAASPGEDIGRATDAGAMNVRYGWDPGLRASNGNNYGLSSIYGQVWSQSGSVPGTPEAGDEFGAAFAVGDFDHDGYDDLAAGAPGETLSGAARGGVVNVLAGSRNGLTPAALGIVSQSGPIAGVPEAGDEFGAALAAGDLDGDGFDDLAIGVPGENSGAGLVTVVWGGTQGLDPASSTSISQAGSTPGTPEPGDRFGAALAIGDVTGDGIADLIVGAPGEAIGSRNGAGLVHVIPGSRGGLTGSGSWVLVQGDGLGGTAEADDHVGAAVATGDVDGDGRHDVVIGVPGEDVYGRSDAGAVHVAPRGLPGGDSLLFQGSGLPGASETGDLIGQAVHVADLDGDGRDDVIIGAPGEGVGSRADAGAVTVLRGSSGPLSSAPATWWSQNGPLAGGAETDDRFGSSLATTDVDGDGHRDLQIGVAGEAVGDRNDAGVLVLVYGSADGLTTANGLMTQSFFGGSVEAGDRLGG